MSCAPAPPPTPHSLRRRRPARQALALVLSTILAIAALTGASLPATSTSEEMPFTVNGVIFYDRNGNGVRDPDEWGLPSLQMALYQDMGNGVWQLRSDPGMHQSGAGGRYGFIMSGYGTYQIRVVTLAFNPNADPQASDFATAVLKNTVPAFQTAASAGWAERGRTTSQSSASPNYVIAHCYNSSTDTVINVNGVRNPSDIAPMLPTQTCFGSQPWPYNNPALPALNANMDSPSYKLNNASGKVVPVYSTVIVWSNASPIPNPDFGLATTADPIALRNINQGQMATMMDRLAQVFGNVMLSTIFSRVVLFR